MSYSLNGFDSGAFYIINFMTIMAMVMGLWGLRHKKVHLKKNKAWEHHCLSVSFELKLRSFEHVVFCVDSTFPTNKLVT